jgi:hypothetical protein
MPIDLAAFESEPVFSIAFNKSTRPWPNNISPSASIQNLLFI